MTLCETRVSTLKLFLSSKSEEERKALLHFLPEKEAQAIAQFPEPVEASSLPFASLADFIPYVHPDRLLPFLESYSDRDKALLITPLGEWQKEFLLNREGLAQPQALPPKALSFILQRWVKWLTPQNFKLEPVLSLPAHRLISFLSLNHEQTERLIFYLGLHDLAPELKKVIESKLLKDIEQVLDETQKEYLKQSMKNPMPLQFSPLKLTSWDRSKESFNEVIRSRGLNRLAKALHGLDASFFWYCAQKLNRKEGAILQKLSIDLKNPKALSALIEEINHTRQFILEGSL